MRSLGKKGGEKAILYYMHGYFYLACIASEMHQPHLPHYQHKGAKKSLLAFAWEVSC